jgi:Holliday junction DNA helicase RuvB
VNNEKTGPLSGIPNEEDLNAELTLRPKSFEEFIGQEKTKANLRLFVAAAKKRNEAFDHILFCGPPGLGKTTLSYIIAKELDVEIRCTSGPVLERPGDLAGMLTNLKKQDVLFIDEIHRMNRIIEEYLYPAMEDFVIDILLDPGPHSRTVKLNLNPFTLIGATTRSGMLTAPLRSRFGLTCQLDYYTTQDLQLIVKRSAKLLNIAITDEAALELGRRARKTPRIANRLLRRARDVAQVAGDGSITLPIVHKTLDMLEVDHLGLDKMDKRIIESIIDKYNGGPVGINTIAVSVGEEPDTIEEVYEPFLIQEGLLMRTPRGREVTPRAYEHFGLPRPKNQANGQTNLFGK